MPNEIKATLTPDQRGDELCVHCKREWIQHAGKSSDCPSGSGCQAIGKHFEGSGRVSGPAKRQEIHCHAAAYPVICTRPHSDTPGYIPRYTTT